METDEEWATRMAPLLCADATAADRLTTSAVSEGVPGMPLAVNPVLNEQVLAFLKKNCRHCFGEGWVRAWIYLDEDTQMRQRMVCKCARGRFLKANAKRVREVGGKLEWIA